MRKNLVTMIAIALLGSFAAYGYTTWQGPTQRENVSDCRGRPVGIDKDYFARLSISGDLTKDETHQVSLDSISQIVIDVSSSWGGGKVTVPSDLINANFTIENAPKSESTGGESSDSQDTQRAAKEALIFQITNLDAKVKSFSYPQRVITGENIFQIVKEKSFVRVYGSRGTVKLSGEAEATLTNRLFSSDNPARVRISFQGKYDFSNRTALLTKIEAYANSPNNSRSLKTARLSCCANHSSASN